MQKAEELGNQQETITEGEAGWLAGFMDGEGSITFQVRRKHKGYLGMDLGLWFCNTDAGIITNMLRILGKMGIEPYLYEKTRSLDDDGNPKIWLKPGKTAIYARIHKQSHMNKILSAIYPYLAGEKKHKAFLVLRLLAKRLNGKNTILKSNYDTEDWWLLGELYKSTNRNAPPDLADRIPRDYTPSAE